MSQLVDGRLARQITPKVSRKSRRPLSAWLTIAAFVATTLPIGDAFAAPRRTPPSDPGPVNEVQREIDGQVVTCRETTDGWIAGTGLRKKFTAFEYVLKQLRKQLTAKKKTLKEQGKNFKKNKGYKKLLERFSATTELAQEAVGVCNAAGENPGAPDPNNPSNPIPVELSLDPLSRPMTNDDVDWFKEHAGWGMNPRRDLYLYELARTGGVNAVVDDQLTLKPEPLGLLARRFERLDERIDRPTTTSNYTPRGMRQAALEMMVHSTNPVLTRLGWETYFLYWTVNERALTNGPEYRMFWQYRELLENAANDPNETLGGVLYKISVHPMMLTFLDNEDSTQGQPNENYARELQQLFSMGTDRWNDECTARVPNYEEQFDGFRQLGDIFQATLALTGWAKLRREIDGTVEFRGVFSEADHRPGPKVIYRGKPWERTIFKLEDLIAAILNHPGTAEGMAETFIAAYVTPNPPCRVVKEYARVIRAQNYNLRAAVSTLFKSNFFYNRSFEDQVLKTPLQRSVQFIHSLGLTYTEADLDPHRPATIHHNEILVNINDLINRLDVQAYAVNSPPSVFGYEENSYISALGYAEAVNSFMSIATDFNTIARGVGTTIGEGNEREGIYYNWWRLPGEALARDAAKFMMSKYRLPLEERKVNELEYFLNHQPNFNGPGEYRDVYDNQESTDKLIRGLVISASDPRAFAQ